jgi:hypothetical protein
MVMNGFVIFQDWICIAQMHNAKSSEKDHD